MTKNEFTEVVRESAGIYLQQHGYIEMTDCEYQKKTEKGRDRFYFDYMPSKKNYAVMLSFYPVYMETVWELYDRRDNDFEGFPCGPYLTPVVISSSARYWKAKNKTVARESLNITCDAIDKIAFPWLDSLREPAAFASSLDTYAKVVKAFAFEHAGDKDKAFAIYEDYYLDAKKGLEEDGITSSFIRVVAKKYLFVAEKLGINEPILSEISEIVKKKQKTGVLQTTF